jgi:hypothetical protein
MKKIIFSFLFLIALISSANSNVVTLTNCYGYKYDNSKYSFIWNEIWAPKKKFSNKHFDVNNIYVDLSNFEMANYYKFSKQTHDKIPGYPEDNLYMYFSKDKKFDVTLDKKNYIINYSYKFKDMKDSYKLKKELLKIYKPNDPYRSVQVDLLNGIIDSKIFEIDGVIHSITRCEGLSDKQINTSSSNYHKYVSKDLYNYKNSYDLIESGLTLMGNKNQYFYSNENPILFYDQATKSMRECEGNVIVGACGNFKPFNSKSYNFDTLYYNPSTGGMQECNNAALGKCYSFRATNSNILSKDQLFYNPRSRSMETCLNSNRKGQCLSFGIPATKKNDTGSYIVDSKINPYLKTVPLSSEALINLGLNILNGSCTLGLNC